MKFEEMFDYIIENEIATKEELKLVLSINGYNEKTITSVLRSRSGFDTFEQHKKFVELQNQSDDRIETLWGDIREALNG